MTVDVYNVGSDYFALYGIPVLRGRTFQSGDTDNDVVLGERMARTLWGSLDPIGHTLSFGNERFTVIGVVREINYPSLDAALDRPEFYQRFNSLGREPMLSVRCRAACPDTGLVRQRLLAAHPGLKVLDVKRIEDIYVEQFAQPRATAALGLTFATIALIAAGCGLFCLLHYAVGRRRREFGIRVALGASPAQVRRLILRDALLVFIAGLAIGAMMARALAHVIASVQYGVTANDPLSWAIVIGMLSVATLSASWRPGREAMRSDPARLLREQ
jgi:putative ABC transport system permease protein